MAAPIIPYSLDILFGQFRSVIATTATERLRSRSAHVAITGGMIATTAIFSIAGVLQISA